MIFFHSILNFEDEFFPFSVVSSVSILFLKYKNVLKLRVKNKFIFSVYYNWAITLFFFIYFKFVSYFDLRKFQIQPCNLSFVVCYFQFSLFILKTLKFQKISKENSLQWVHFFSRYNFQQNMTHFLFIFFWILFHFIFNLNKIYKPNNIDNNNILKYLQYLLKII